MLRWLFIFSTMTFASPKINCVSEALKNTFLIPGAPASYDLKKFEADLMAAYPKSPWKRRLLSNIWKSELEQGLTKLNLQYLVNQKNPFLHYAKLPNPIFQSFVQSALEKGLSPAQKFLVIPTKLLITEAVLRPWTSGVIVLALTADDKILDSLHLSFNDPMIDESDPSTLKKNEVFVITLLDRDHQADDTASAAAWEEARGLVKQNPEKFMILDLTDIENYQKNIDRLALTLSQQGKTIRKMVIDSHAEPGRLSSIIYPAYGEPTNLAKTLGNLKPLLKPSSEVFFTGCNLARGDEGKKSVRDFAMALMPVGSQVYANETFGIIYGGRPEINPALAVTLPQLKVLIAVGSMVDKPLMLIGSQVLYGGDGAGKLLLNGDRYHYQR